MEKESIGELLRKRRNELSLTQRQVANQVGVTEATVSRWESGDIDNMRRDKIAGLANALKVSPLLIMGVENSEQYYRPVNVEESELLDDYREVPAEDKSLIRGMLKRFKIGRVPAVPRQQAAAV
ncbi:MAG: helix-turn-helix domain-containing protein [Selenomonadaceae bacterium]|nr:helix-turn-helix domain-containing protein [Selenomonadaceae bacterium]